MQGEPINRCKIKFTNGDKVVELIREDGTLEVHRLAK